MEDSLTRDDFLGGAVTLLQPRKGYRAGVDAVLLAAAVPAKPGETVLELGCGVGTAALCLMSRVVDLDVVGVELQADYAELARRNGLENVVMADLRELPADLRQRQFNHVIMNPPYFDRQMGDKASDPGRDIGRGGDTLLSDWIDTGIRRTAPKGHLTIIQHITRLPEVIACVQGRLGSIVVKPIVPRQKSSPTVFILQAQQNGRAPFQLSPALVMHEGTVHPGDKEHFTEETRQILRNAAPLPMSD